MGMGKKNGVPRQSVDTWRFVLDFTTEQAAEYHRLMGGLWVASSAEHMLGLMRIGKAQVDGYVYVEEPEGDWKSIEFEFDGKETTLYKVVKDEDHERFRRGGA
jgi:hypothetical protein